VKALVFALALFAGAAQAFTGVVTRVSDGDTLWVRPDVAAEQPARKPVKLRLRGIDAPERCQPWGPQARAALEARVLHRRVDVAAKFKDDYDRLLGDLRLDGDDVSAWMVEQGHAWSHRYRGKGPYGELEDQARAAARGLFGERDPMQPRLFRQWHGPCG